MSLRLAAACGLIGLLAACNTQNDLRNGAIGAGVGCAVGQVVDDACLEGAAIGGVGGVLANDI